MSEYWEGDGQAPVPNAESPASPEQAASAAYLAPDLSLPVEDGPSPMTDAEVPAPRRSLRKRVMAVAAVMSVVVAFSVVATINARVGGVRAALASVFSSPTLKVVISAHTTDLQEQSAVSQYSVAVTVTSQNGSRPLSGSDGVDDYEVSVLRGGTDLGDLIIAD
ncbi:MAG TPA: hypothetical protein VKA05_07700, partial [Acidimicrobiales bacterium]|nr:hypothetical protein [Acidimicrobiales bacterium]